MVGIHRLNHYYVKAKVFNNAHIKGTWEGWIFFHYLFLIEFYTVIDIKIRNNFRLLDVTTGDYTFYNGTNILSTWYKIKQYKVFIILK